MESSDQMEVETAAESSIAALKDLLSKVNDTLVVEVVTKVISMIEENEKQTEEEMQYLIDVIEELQEQLNDLN